jgi:HNH endonuclease
LNTDDLKKFIAEFQDFLAPKLDTYEQAIYLYVFRHSRFLGIDEIVIGMALGVGQEGSPMSESSVYKKLSSLERKGYLQVVQVEHKGRRLRLKLPSEIPDCVPVIVTHKEIDIEDMDFFNDPINRKLILQREDFRCFYTLRPINDESFVIEHIVSRPLGSNSYRNVVAASRDANNKKGNSDAKDFFRRLMREGYLSTAEFEERLVTLARLQAGELKPNIGSI